MGETATNAKGRKRGHLLMLSYFFPPLGAGGVQRSLKLAKYLPDCNVDVTVLTPKPVAYLAYDQTLLEEIPPAVKVVRTPSADPARLAWLLKRLLGRGEDRQDEDEISSGKGIRGAWFLQKLKWWVTIPDAEVFWLPYAIPAAGRVIQTAHHTVIYSTSPPNSTHLLGFLLKKRWRLPWIADFRDLWADHYDFINRPYPLRLLIESMERVVFNNADRVICNTPGMLEFYAGKYPTSHSRLRLIPNGYDEEDFRDLSPQSSDGDYLRLVHMGALRGDRSLTTVIKAMVEVERDSSVLRKWILEQAGVFHAHLIKGLDQSDLSDRVRLLGNLSHRQALARAAAAEALLLLISPNEGDKLVPAKLYEYLRLGRPIIIMAPEGDAVRLARDLAQAVVFAPDDFRGLAEYLARGKPPIPTISRTKLMCFERRRLAAKLADLVAEVLI